jgi:hypothetical protein
MVSHACVAEQVLVNLVLAVVPVPVLELYVHLHLVFYIEVRMTRLRTVCKVRGPHLTHPRETIQGGLLEGVI